jgi:DNA-binding response OmpR family regulator
MKTAAKTVLIVEDERPLAHALELKLGSVGITTKTVSNGQECMDALAEKKFDVVLLDLMLPIVDGFQVMAQIKEKQYTPVVFVLSNLSQLEDEKRALEMGARKFFVKSDTSLATIVQEVTNLT